MNNLRRKTEWLVWGGLGLTILGIATAFVVSRLHTPRPTQAPLPVISSALPEVALTNQFGEPFTTKSLLGKVWVADIIFTRCAGPCPEMTRKMSQLQTNLQRDQSVQLVTLTTDPKFDSPPVLARYAKRFGAQPERWTFLTGSSKDIARLAVDGLKLTALEQKPEEQTTPEDLFVHSTWFALVDRHGRLRKAFETSEPGWKEPLLDAISALLREK